jgi:hypothetical protein
MTARSRWVYILDRRLAGSEEGRLAAGETGGSCRCFLRDYTRVPKNQGSLDLDLHRVGTLTYACFLHLLFSR